MFVDRSEIHIQAFGDFIYAHFIISRSSSPDNYIKLREVLIFKKTEATETNTSKTKRRIYLSKNRKISNLQILIYENNMLQGRSHNFLYLLKYLGDSWEVCGAGPGFDKTFEVPEIIRKVLE